MDLTHSEIKTILEWCDERNWTKKEICKEFIDELKKHQETFPKGRGVLRIRQWWYEDKVSIYISPDMADQIIKAIHDNTAMEDANLPHGLLLKLKAVRAM